MAWTFDSVVDTKQDTFGVWYSRVRMTSPEETRVVHLKFRAQPTNPQITRAVQAWRERANNEDEEDNRTLFQLVEAARVRGFTKNQIRNKLVELLN